MQNITGQAVINSDDFKTHFWKYMQVLPTSMKRSVVRMLFDKALMFDDALTTNLQYVELYE